MIEPAPGSQVQNQDMTDTSRHVVPFQVAARELGLSAATLRRLCSKGDGPRLLRLSMRRLGIRRCDLDAWVASREIDVGAAART